MVKSTRIFILFTTLLSLAFGALAQQATDTTPQRPKSYQVQQGDTLWDIAERFLFAPWLWKEIWHSNPEIKNPDRIYPGDVVYLADIQGKLSLKVMRGSTVKLSPGVRSTPITQEVLAIPIDAIHQFLTRPYVIDDNASSRPYVVAFADDRIIAGANSRIYVRGELEEDQLAYNLVRPGKPYVDSLTGESLGREALWVGEVRLMASGDPATFFVKEAEREVVVGDRLYPLEDEHSLQAFYPKSPDTEIEGGIISVLDGVSQIGQYDVVVLDRGADHGLRIGDVLRIDHQGATIRDKISEKAWDEVTLPSHQAASLMVFRTFPKVSFALVMQASRPLHIGDRVRNPSADPE